VVKERDRWVDLELVLLVNYRVDKGANILLETCVSKTNGTVRIKSRMLYIRSGTPTKYNDPQHNDIQHDNE
jgi:hypothetical protein